MDRDMSARNTGSFRFVVAAAMASVIGLQVRRQREREDPGRGERLNLTLPEVPPITTFLNAVLSMSTDNRDSHSHPSLCYC